MFYTIEPMDEIFREESPVSEIKALPYGHVELINGKINRVCSTDPSDYLKYTIG